MFSQVSINLFTGGNVSLVPCSFQGVGYQEVEYLGLGYPGVGYLGGRVFMG